MNNAHLHQLVTTLETLDPLKLEAVNLLQTLRSQTGEWLPTTLTPETKEQVITATVELVAYTRRSANMARLLSQLQPIPLRDVPVVESQP
ncbi:MAG: hypothetical protein BroJett018_22230 [Chloroflexota bacterium]|nr:hypothetical protein [Chloroflexota bacterium]NOG66122.1 hypothetical protein [Chloroflexota bacterium]GIK64429.1 MAG: hypothetical protein BroJett018_22230 [Chloroflexota bacterium]